MSSGVGNVQRAFASKYRQRVGRAVKVEHLGIPDGFRGHFRGALAEDGLHVPSSYVKKGGWCAGQESNLHALRRLDLNQVRLPIPPPAHSAIIVYRLSTG